MAGHDRYDLRSQETAGGVADMPGAVRAVKYNATALKSRMIPRRGKTVSTVSFVPVVV